MKEELETPDTVTEEQKPPAEATPAPEGTGTSLVLAGELLPGTLPILPSRRRPLFPGLQIPLEVPPDQIAAVEYALQSTNQTIGIVLVKNPEAETSARNLYDVGVAAKVVKIFRAEEGPPQILIACMERFRI